MEQGLQITPGCCGSYRGMVSLIKKGFTTFWINQDRDVGFLGAKLRIKNDFSVFFTYSYIQILKNEHQNNILYFNNTGAKFCGGRSGQGEHLLYFIHKWR